MKTEDKQSEYQLMINSPKHKLMLYLPNGRLIICDGCWDVHKDLKCTVFKTANPYIASVNNPDLERTIMDLAPVTTKKIWRVIARHQPNSNLLNKSNNGNNSNQGRKGRPTNPPEPVHDSSDGKSPSDRDIQV